MTQKTEATTSAHEWRDDGSDGRTCHKCGAIMSRGTDSRTFARCSGMTVEADDDPRFWIIYDIDNVNGPADWQAAGTLVGIVDEKEGGIVAYCHDLNADKIVAALYGLPDDVEDLS